MRDYCNVNNINEIYFVKNKCNSIFITKNTNEIKEYTKWEGPRLCILNDIQRVVNVEDRRVILNDFHILATSGHAGVRRMFNNI